jgi:NAD+ diphosphatase
MATTARDSSASKERLGSAIPGFAGVTLDRAPAERRRPEWLAARRAEPGARTALLSERGVWVQDGHLLLARPGPAAVFLGLSDGVPLFAEEATGPGPERGGPVGLREAASQLPADEAALAAYAGSLLGWHRRHRFCANCGQATEPRDAGHERFCPACHAQHFPRTDPVVIVRVTDAAGRLLLGRQQRWPEGRFSLLAGYVEPGETLEQAVRREVLEEAGVTLEEVSYLASQPWPFPSSLMLGFQALAVAGEPRADEIELAEVRWFDRREVDDAAAGRGDVLLPPSFSIARRLIDGWLAETAAQRERSGRSG